MADCLFCSIVAGSTPAHLVLETPDVVGFLDIRPVFKGHTLIVPREAVTPTSAFDSALLTGLSLLPENSRGAEASRLWRIATSEMATGAMT